MINTGVLKEKIACKKLYSLVDCCNFLKCTEIEMVSALLTMLKEEVDLSIKDGNEKSTSLSVSIIYILRRVNEPYLMNEISKVFNSLLNICSVNERTDNYSSVTTLCDKLETSLYYMKGIKSLDKPHDEAVENLLSYIIFNKKEQRFLKQFLKNYKGILSINSDESEKIIEDITSRYIISLLNEDEEDIIYYEHVLDSIFYSNEFEISQENKLHLFRTIAAAEKELSDILSDNKKIKEMNNRLNILLSDVDSMVQSKEAILNEIEVMRKSYKSASQQLDTKYVECYLNSITKSINKNDYSLEVLTNVSNFIYYLEKIEKPSVIVLRLKRNAYKLMKFLTFENFNPMKTSDIKEEYNLPSSDEEFEVEFKINENATDLRYLDTYTIDNPNTSLFDDAIAYTKDDDGNQEICVFVADPTSVITPGSPLDEYAFKVCRQCFSSKVYRIFPEELYEELSLKENCDRNAIGFFFKFDKDGNYLGWRTDRCIINVNKNLDYNDATKFMARKETDRNISNKLTHIQILANKLPVGDFEEYRKTKFDSNAEYEPENDTESIPSLMISRIMTFVNITVANYFANHLELPFVFKNDSFGLDDKTREELYKIAGNDFRLKELVSILDKSYRVCSYSTFPTGHDGLKVPYYANVTNPLRNYESLESLRLISRFIIDNDTELTDEDRKNIEDRCKYFTGKANKNYLYGVSVNRNKQKVKKKSKKSEKK